MTEVIFSFETQKQADAAVMALSKGYKVEQYTVTSNLTISTKPYIVRVWVPNVDVISIRADI